MNFRLPQQQDHDFDYYGNSSQDESRGSQGSHLMFPLHPSFIISLVLLCSCLKFHETLASQFLHITILFYSSWFNSEFLRILWLKSSVSVLTFFLFGASRWSNR